jgi:adenosylcobinamide kinase/adenosylcobinamide-phosphate guanylyltransferase
MKNIFVIGGARSGKSSFALKEASKIKGQKAYIATAEALDEEMKERIEKHKTERGNEWDTFEETMNIPDLLSNLKNKYSVILIDCLTLWLSNIFMRTQGAEDRTQTVDKTIKDFINGLSGFNDLSLYIVSNEVGTGIVPVNKLARQFRDRAGFLNQKVAEIADEVYLITAGIPLQIK